MTSRFISNKEVASVTPKFVIPELSPEPLVLNSDKAVAPLPIDDLIPLALARARGRTVQKLAQERSVASEVIDFSLSKVFLDYNPICFKNEKGFLSTNKLAKKYLSDAKISLKKKDLFYIALEKALHNFLKSKLSIETSDYTKEKIIGLMTEKNIESKSIELFIKLIENCEYARYTPASNVAINNDYEDAVNVISEIDNQI